MWKYIALVVFIWCFNSLEAQKLVSGLKKKYFGEYIGVIPAYSYNTGNDLIEVSKTEIEIELTESTIVLTIGLNKRTGSYVVLFKGDKYYVLEAKFENELKKERIIVPVKGKSISREGTYPQPNAELVKH